MKCDWKAQVSCGGGVLTTGPDCALSYAFLKQHKFFSGFFYVSKGSYKLFVCGLSALNHSKKRNSKIKNPKFFVNAVL